MVDQRRAFLFFDEIQVVPGCERRVRACNETEDVKICATGSTPPAHVDQPSST